MLRTSITTKMPWVIQLQGDHSTPLEVVKVLAFRSGCDGDSEDSVGGDSSAGF